MKKKGLFICSPGLGLMDNWMPVIYELNKSKKSKKIQTNRINQ